MKDAILYFILAILFCFLSGTMIGMTVGSRNSYHNLKQEAVKLGHAEWYSDQPGCPPTKWRWKGGNISKN